MILEQERRQAEAQWAAQEDQRLRAEFEREKARRAAEEAAIQREQEADRKRKMGEEEQRRRAQAALLLDRLAVRTPSANRQLSSSDSPPGKGAPKSPARSSRQCVVRGRFGGAQGEVAAQGEKVAARWRAADLHRMQRDFHIDED